VEENLRRSLQLSDGDLSIFFSRPISLAFLIVAMLVLVMMMLPAVRMQRDDIID
jgi:putative tricarboxylic transport membrane protein